MRAVASGGSHELRRSGSPPRGVAAARCACAAHPSGVLLAASTLIRPHYSLRPPVARASRPPPAGSDTRRCSCLRAGRPPRCRWALQPGSLYPKREIRSCPLPRQVSTPRENCPRAASTSSKQTENRRISIYPTSFVPPSGTGRSNRSCNVAKSTHSSTRNPPLRTRLKAVKCAPLPNRRPKSRANDRI